MDIRSSAFLTAIMTALAGVPGPAWSAYLSGSTGADGAFNPTVSQSVQLPDSGVFNYTSVNIPAGVTITYKKNAANTPVTLLASGDVTIAGTINVGATAPADANDISGPGLGGPGGYNGGRGGQAGGDAGNWVNGSGGPNIGRAGVGPGGGAPGTVIKPNPTWNATTAGPGGGGSYSAASAGVGSYCPATPGATYGNVNMLPLVGGSGGGGGAGGSVLPGTGGGGGGGAILIAASGTISVTGSILADGGLPVSATTTNGRGARGGGGSGGAIRLIATTISGNGTISAAGGSYSGEFSNQSVGSSYYVCTSYDNGAHNGGPGRIRLESETLTRTAATNPLYVGGAPGPSFVPGLPSLRIASIAGLAVPATPTGNGDVTLSPDAPNPVTVAFVTSGITVGTSIKLTVIPPLGNATVVTSAPTSGSLDGASASVDVNIPTGSSILQASLTYTVVAAVGDAMSVYAQGERVEQVRLVSTLGGDATATLITLSGKEYPVPLAVLAAFRG